MSVLGHMKSLRHLVAEPEADSAVVNGPEHTKLNIKITALGYPVLPNVIMKMELSKVECEKLLRIYLSQHYCVYFTIWPANSNPNPNQILQAAKGLREFLSQL
jgi:hypothetical protein